MSTNRPQSDKSSGARGSTHLPDLLGPTRTHTDKVFGFLPCYGRPPPRPTQSSADPLAQNRSKSRFQSNPPKKPKEGREEGGGSQLSLGSHLDEAVKNRFQAPRAFSNGSRPRNGSCTIWTTQALAYKATPPLAPTKRDLLCTDEVPLVLFAHGLVK